MEHRKTIPRRREETSKEQTEKIEMMMTKIINNDGDNNMQQEDTKCKNLANDVCSTDWLACIGELCSRSTRNMARQEAGNPCKMSTCKGTTDFAGSEAHHPSMKRLQKWTDQDQQVGQQSSAVDGSDHFDPRVLNLAFETATNLAF